MSAKIGEKFPNGERVEIADNYITSDMLADGALAGDKVLPVVENSGIGALPVVHVIDVADDTPVVVEFAQKTQIIDAWAVKVGAGASGDSVQLLNGASAITDDMDLEVSAGDVVRASSIALANAVIDAGEDLTIAGTEASDCACKIFILGVVVE